MASSPLAVGALGLAVVAVGLSAAAFLRARDTGRGDGDPPIADARLERLEQEVARLAERGGRAPESSRTRVPAAPPGGSGGDTSVDERLAALESSVEELEEDLADTEAKLDALAEAAREGPLKAIQDSTPTPAQVAELRKLVLDPKAETRPRLLALRALARAPGGRTIEIARAMRKLFEQSEDERTRTSVVAFLQGFVDPELEPWLVETLLTDRYSSTRESATDVLSHYVGSQRVRDALRDAAENDTNHDVRADAQNALDKLDEREEE